MGPIKILFLGANPAGTTPLDLAEEARRIQEAINNSRSRDVLKLQTEWAVRRNDLNRLLRQHEPNVLHFSGHADSKGLVLHEEDGSTAYLTTVGLRALLELFRDNLRLVVLNGCSTDERARAIADVVGCVVGTQREITDPAACAFSEFYGALGDGHSVNEALKHATAQIAAERPGEQEVVNLYPGKGIDANRYFIVPKAPLCYFCQAQADDLESSLVLEGKRETHRTYSRNTTTIHYLVRYGLVPRCARCKHLHSFVESTAWWTALCAVPGGLLLAVLFIMFDAWFPIGIGAGIVLVWGMKFVVRRFVAKGTTPGRERLLDWYVAHDSALKLRDEGFTVTALWSKNPRSLTSGVGTW